MASSVMSALVQVGAKHCSAPLPAVLTKRYLCARRPRTDAEQQRRAAGFKSVDSVWVPCYWDDQPGDLRTQMAEKLVSVIEASGYPYPEGRPYPDSVIKDALSRYLKQRRINTVGSRKKQGVCVCAAFLSRYTVYEAHLCCARRRLCP